VADPGSSETSLGSTTAPSSSTSSTSSSSAGTSASDSTSSSSDAATDEGSSSSGAETGESSTEAPTGETSGEETGIERSCAVNNGECGDPTYWSCTNTESGVTCENIDQCAVDNGGCGDPQEWTCTDQADGPPLCDCEPVLQFISTFTLTDATDPGCNPSILLPALDHVNTMTIDFASWEVRRGIGDNYGIGQPALVTSVHSEDWTVTFTGADEDLLNEEIAPYYARGNVINDGVFQIDGNGLYYLYILPEDTDAHLYTHVREYSEELPEQDAGGFPLLQDLVLTGAEVRFFDFVGSNECNLTADDGTFEIVYRACEPPE